MTNWIIEKFSGSGGIRTHDLWVTSPLLYQLRYRDLGAVRGWILIYMADVIPVTSCKLTISPGWSQCFDSILEPSSLQHQWWQPTLIMTNWIIEKFSGSGRIRTHDLFVFSPLLYQLHYRAFMSSAWVNPCLHGTSDPVTSCKLIISPGWSQCLDSISEPPSGQHQWWQPTLIMTNWIIEKFSGSGGIRTHDLRVTTPLLYQLCYRALGAVHEWIPIYMAHVMPLTSWKLTISPGWSQCFDSILEPSSGQHQWWYTTLIMTNWIIEKFSGSSGIRTHDLFVTSPLMYQLHYRALGAVHEWIPIYMTHVIPVTSCKLIISPGWSQCFNSI